MGDSTSIQWTDHTFNPWVGCTKVSPGCTNCYAEALDKRWGNARWGAGKPRTRTSEANWKAPLRWDRAAKRDGRRARVFCASLADVFDAEVPPDWRRDLFALIEKTPNLDWQLLTKRPEHFAEMAMPDGWLPNVWLGVTVEDQVAAEKRVPLLVQQEAAVLFLSCEPLLAPVDLQAIRMGDPSPLDCEGAPFLDALRGATWWPDGDHSANTNRVGWVIVGGESGPTARAFDITWARALRDQCLSQAVPCFIKQLGAKPLDCSPDRQRPAIHTSDRKGGDWDEWPSDLRVRKFPPVRT